MEVTYDITTNQSTKRTYYTGSKKASRKIW